MSADSIGGFFNAGVGALGAFSSLRQGKSEARTIERNAQNQADAMAWNARQVQSETTQQENLMRRQNRAALAKQSAAQAQSGVSGAGTAVNVMDQSLIDAELDALTLRASGNNQADAMRWDAQNTLLSAKSAASAAKSKAYASAAGLLGQSAAHLYGVFSSSQDHAQAGEALQYEQGGWLSRADNQLNSSKYFNSEEYRSGSGIDLATGKYKKGSGIKLIW